MSEELTPFQQMRAEQYQRLQTREQSRVDVQAEIDRVLDTVAIFDSPKGEAFLAYLDETYGGPVFDENALKMARNEGRRLVLIDIKQLREIARARR